jgi:ATP-dependent DNA helicase RecG
MDTLKLSPEDLSKLYSRTEGHFLDFKSKAILPAKLTRSISAFANSDGGELFVGIEEPSSGGPKTWDGFPDEESANGFIQAIEQICPLGDGLRLSFLAADDQAGLLLYIEIFKNRDIVRTTSNDVYVRRGAQNLPVATSEALDRLKLNKGYVPITC